MSSSVNYPFPRIKFESEFWFKHLFSFFLFFLESGSLPFWYCIFNYEASFKERCGFVSSSFPGKHYFVSVEIRENSPPVFLVGRRLQRTRKKPNGTNSSDNHIKLKLCFWKNIRIDVLCYLHWSLTVSWWKSDKLLMLFFENRKIFWFYFDYDLYFCSETKTRL